MVQRRVEVRTITEQTCEGCGAEGYLTFNGSWLCDVCLESYCSECGWELFSLYEFERQLCSGCLANDHLADIGWDDAME